MGYPQELNSKIRIRKNTLFRDIADAEGFDVISLDGSTITLTRNRPVNIKLAGHLEFIASLPVDVIAAAAADVRIVC
ncbi:hypothetical protein [Bradyrhizobium sp. SZCCHNS3051]|uniref:hypothetical protein n=1 Tax=Bradyrhizobium sp. SZCCHNS3051 TaxID=3057320 RepID=UPI002915E2F1|nr:hypothetical protein [Bradyrhizobium sp. SZCCHNS3051]